MNTIDRFRIRGLCGALAAALCLGLAPSAGAWSQPQWVRQLGTPNSVAAGVAADGKGHVYIAANTITVQSTGDAWLAKFSAAGVPLWIRKLGTPDWDHASGVATDEKGDIYIAGSTGGSLGGPNQGGSDAWIAKYSAAGILLWKRQLGTSQVDVAAGVATDDKGHVYIAGWTETHCTGNLCDNDSWIAKYSAFGALIWKRVLLKIGSVNTSTGVATDPHDNVVVWTFGGPTSAWISKYSAAGVPLWQRQLQSDYNSIGGVATGNTGNKGEVYITGWTSGSLGGPNQGSSDVFVAKYSAAGVPLWTRQLGTPDWDDASGITTDGIGNVYLAGDTSGSLGGPNQGDADAWIAKYSAAGSLLWKRQLGTPGADLAAGVATDDNDGVYMAGFIFISGDYRAWIAKYSQRP
jgi:hypothetical protein